MIRPPGTRVAAALAAGVLTAAAVAAAMPAAAHAASPVITDLAGTGVAGKPTAGPATSSKLRTPSGVVVDASGDVYVADTDNDEVDEITPAGTLSIVAGTGTAGAPTPGPATSSKLNGPTGVALDSNGNLFIADAGNDVIEKVTPSGTLSIYAGTGTAGAPTFGGAATASELNDPQGVGVGPANNLFIADTGNDEVEKVLHASGNIQQIAGTGAAGAPTPGAAATSSNLKGPQAVAVNPATSNIYVADTGNDDVEMVTNSGGKLSIIAGTGAAGTPTAGTATQSALNAPDGLGFDASGDLYIADTGNDDVEEISSGTLAIVAGTGAAGAPTYGGAAASSALDAPAGLAVDTDNDVDIADGANHTVDQVNVPGTLAISSSAAPTFSDNLDSGDQTPTYTLPLTVQNTGSGAEAGWNLTVTSTPLSTGGATPATLSSSASSVTGVTSSCSSSCTNPANSVSYPLTVPAASTPPPAVKFFQAQNGSGLGTFTITPTIGVTVPQNSFKGTYTSTVTVSVVSGP